MSGLLAFLAGAWNIICAIFGRRNQPDIVANKVAQQDQHLEDENAALEAAAANGDAKALAELRRRLSEE